LVRTAGAGLVNDATALDHLRSLLARRPESHAMAASLLHAADSGWVPGADEPPRLAGAYLDKVAWPGVSLAAADLCEADRSGADLRQANLDGAPASRANLRSAQLAGATLQLIQALGTDLSHADLSAVRAQKGRFDAANLEGANLANATLADASFLA